MIPVGLNTKGRLLVATPPLDDPNFDRTVVYMIEHDDGGRRRRGDQPSERHRAPRRARPLERPARHSRLPVRGRPGRDRSTDRPRPPPAATDADDEHQVAITDDLSSIDLSSDPTLVTDTGEIRVFQGYSGWGPGQLDLEIAAGGWLVLDRRRRRPVQQRTRDAVAPRPRPPTRPPRLARRSPRGSVVQSESTASWREYRRRMATIFTRIISGEIPGTFVYDDDLCVAFMSINPLRRGHTLVVSRQEIDHWIDAPAELRAQLFDVAHRIGEAQQRAFEPDPDRADDRRPGGTPPPRPRRADRRRPRSRLRQRRPLGRSRRPGVAAKRSATTSLRARRSGAEAGTLTFGGGDDAALHLGDVGVGEAAFVGLQPQPVGEAALPVVDRRPRGTRRTDDRSTRSAPAPWRIAFSSRSAGTSSGSDEGDVEVARREAAGRLPLRHLRLTAEQQRTG